MVSTTPSRNAAATIKLLDRWRPIWHVAGSLFLHAFDGDAGIDQRMKSFLALSSDGLHWQRLRQSPFLEPGFSGHGFDERSVLACGTWLPLDERRIVLFCLGRGQPAVGDDPLSAVGRLAAMTLRRDGFVAATPGQRGPTVVRDNATGEQRQVPAGDASGYLLTREFVMPAGGLTVNADARRGAVRVEVVERATTRPYAGFARGDCLPLAGDEVAAPARWKNAEIATLAGKPVMRRFVLEPEARLFAVTFGRENDTGK
jgi:hypothetical protein